MNIRVLVCQIGIYCRKKVLILMSIKRESIKKSVLKCKNLLTTHCSEL